MHKIILIVALAMCSNFAAAETYKCVQNGKTSYQTSPCDTAKDVQSTKLPISSSERGASGLACGTPKDIMSLNFYDMPLRTALQVIADFSNQKLVADSSVTGRGAFQYQSRPWCEILADIAQRQQLEVRSENGTLYVKHR